MKAHSTALVLVLLSLLGAVAGAQEAAQNDDGIFLDTLDVYVVNVDVFVTDKKGNRITGLTKDDFELYQNGKPVALTNFYVVEDGNIKQGGVELPMLEEAPETEAVAGEISAPEDQRLSLIIYVDNFNLHPFSRNRAFGDIRSFLRTRLNGGDRVMLISYDRSLHERHPFTQDPELIASSLYDLEDKSAHAVHRDSDRRDIMEAIFDSESLYEVRGRVQTFAENQYNDLSFTIRAMRDMVDRLAGLPGRKAILYVSDGLAMRAGEDLYYALNEKYRDSSMLMEAFRYDLSREYQTLIRAANANRVTFYTLDAEGLRTYQYLDVRNRNPGGGSFVDQTHFANIQAPLQMIAEETGGFAMINTNSFNKHLGRMGEDFDTYYSLGYSPAGGGSGRYNRIEVRIKGRKDLRARHREGFRDKAVNDRMSEGTLAALYHGYEKNGLGVALEVGKGAQRRDGHFDVPLTIKVPIGRLALLPQDEAHHGRIRFYIAARDGDGGMSQVQDVPVPIEIPAASLEDARSNFYEYEIRLMMRRGNQLIAVGVHDEIGAETAFVSSGVTVGRL